MNNFFLLNAYKFLLLICIAFIIAVAYFYQDLIGIVATSTSKLIPIFQNSQMTSLQSDMSEGKVLAQTKATPLSNSITIIQLTNKKETDNEYHVYAESRRNKHVYASLHNYTVFVDEPPKDTGGRHVYWYKFISIQKAFNITRADDWVWLVDSDTIITNMNIELNRLTHYAAKLNYHIILTRSCGDINGGSILYRNSALSLSFVRDAWNSMGKEVDVSDEWRDQRAVIVQSRKDAYKNSIMYVPVNCMNSIPVETIKKYPVPCANQTEWRVGDFLVHFAGNHDEKLFFQFVNKSNAINSNRDDLREFNTENWLNFINDWRRNNNFSVLF